MAHELNRLLRAAGAGYWFIDPRKAEQILAMLEVRIAAGPRGEAWGEGQTLQAAVDTTNVGQKTIRVINLQGTITPRGNMLSDMSGAVSLDRFCAAFDQAANDPSTAAIILNFDSPGGNVAMVPETVARIRAQIRADRPIVAVANTMCASAAYWLACACDEIVVTPSGEVGSIGVYCAHQDISGAMEAEGVSTTLIYEGPRKVEGNPFGPLDDAAKAAFQAGAKYFYDLFTKDVAKGRNVPLSTVTADPETDAAHMGGGRCYPATQAVKLGMADRVATLEETISRLSKPIRARQRADVARAKLALA